MNLLHTIFNRIPQKKLLLPFVLNSLLFFFLFAGPQAARTILSPLPFADHVSHKVGSEVFGFAPHWTLDKMDNVDFSVLTTLAYFGVDIGANGALVRDDAGYESLGSEPAQKLFAKARDHGTRVVLTVTQMENATIMGFLSNEKAQAQAVEEIVAEVKAQGMDGVNIDIEYLGNASAEQRDALSTFVAQLTTRMHKEMQGSSVTISVYASAVKEQKLYDVAALSKDSDGIFMMAYDFAAAGSDAAMPTAPLYGHKEGDYWYDISSAVEDFLTVMPADKLILGLPWYGYDYAVHAPEVKAETNKGYYQWVKRGKRTVRVFVPQQGRAQTYAIAQDTITPDMQGVSEFKEGWDETGKVGFKAYRLASNNTWRMLFFDDTRSLGIKYDFAKEKQLKGVGMWALGFDHGRGEMWDLLEEKFGPQVREAKTHKLVFAK